MLDRAKMPIDGVWKVGARDHSVLVDLSATTVDHNVQQTDATLILRGTKGARVRGREPGPECRIWGEGGCKPERAGKSACDQLT